MTENQLQTRHLYVESPWLVFNHLDWTSLTGNLKAEFFRKGSYLYHQNQPDNYVYIIKHGRVNISIINADGNVKSLFICSEGTLFGEISCFTVPDNCAQAQTVSDSYIYKIEKTKFQAELETNHTIALNAAQVLAKKIRALTAQIEEMSFSGATGRIADMLLYLAEQYGKQHDGATTIMMRFTHQEMANLIGTSRVTVTNTFKMLTDLNIIRKSNGLVQMLDCDKLHELSVHS